MKIQTSALLIGLLVLAGAIGVLVQSQAPVPPRSSASHAATSTNRPVLADTANSAPPAVKEAELAAAPAVSLATKVNLSKKAKASKPAAKAKEPIQDPTARAALSLVGMDPEAEDYWYGAINDPKLSAEERQDLIEDLNEDGLSDPKHPAAEDLPLIVNRLQLIEEAAPYAMDQVNAEAFQEAYKDLVAMLNGEPVK